MYILIYIRKGKGKRHRPSRYRPSLRIPERKMKEKGTEMIDAINQWLDWLYEEHEIAYAILANAVLFTLIAIGGIIELW